MHIKFKNMSKRVVSGVTALVMTSAMITIKPVFADTGVTEYSYDGYDVSYNVVNEWQDGETIEITVTNTGDMPIYNWAFKYNTQGEIDGLWNAEISLQNDSEYVVRNDYWNYKIEPDQSITFGYTLKEKEFSVPEDFELMSEMSELNDGYDVELNITNQWDTGVKGELVIINTTDSPIEAWQLSFDSNFAINNLWDGCLTESKDNHYIVSSEAWSNPIEAGSSQKIGFTALINSDTEAKISNCKLGHSVINDPEINWDDPKDTDSDGLPDVYEKHAYNCDPKNADTDNDKLPDGYEVITLHTDPSSADSDNNDITDDIEDFDSDGLTNYEEYILKTDPYNPDTDDDGLSDYEEVHTYFTVPLNPDTDNDGVPDADEISMGLDPSDPSDANTPVRQVLTEEELAVNKYNDSFEISMDVKASNNIKRFIKQSVSRYSGILSDNKAIIGLPVDITYNAGTIAEGTVTFRLDSSLLNDRPSYFTGLNEGIERYGVFCYDKKVGTIVPVPCEYDAENSSIIIDAKYLGSLMLVDYESLMYDLGIEPSEADGEITAEELPAVSEETDVHTGLDVMAADNSVNEEAEYNDLTEEDIKEIICEDNDEPVRMMAAPVMHSIGNVFASSGAMRQVDLVLVVDTTGSMGPYIESVKKNLSQLIADLRKNEGISLYVSIVDYRDITCDGIDSTKVNNNSGVDFYNQTEDITQAISGLYPDGGGDTEECTLDGLGKTYYLDCRNSAAKFAFVITDAGYKTDNNFEISDMTEMAEMLKSKGITASVVTNPYEYSYYEKLTEITGGELIDMSGDFCDDMYNVIFKKTPESSVVIANNLVTGYFKEPLLYGSSCDTDNDSLSDSDEVDWDNVKKVNEDGTYVLYTWKELCEKSGIWPSDYDAGKKNPLFASMSDVLVIPAFSNPFSADTDKDYYPDNEDEDVLTANPMYIYDSGIDDSDFHNGSDITVKTPDKFTDGNPVADQDEKTLKYVFKRRSNNFAYFTITPEQRSFYKLINSADKNNYVYVSYEKGFGFWKETKYIKPDDDGLYLLEGGKDYTIEVYGLDSTDFDFSIQQDNWKFAPNGGKWTVDKYSDSSVISSGFGGSIVYDQLYVSQDMLYASIADLIGTKTKINDIESLEKIMKDLGYDSSDYTVTGGDVFNVVLADGSLLLGIYSLATGVGETGIAAIFATKSSIAGAASTIFAVTDDVLFAPNKNLIDKLNNYLEKQSIKNAFRLSYEETGEYNVYGVNRISMMSTVWYKWDSYPYINKIDVMGDTGKVDVFDYNDVKTILDFTGWS